MIESDPEDDIEVQKYSSNRTENSTPSYSMDTDISTLEAPTFTTLSSQGPSQINSLIWDHPVNLIGKKVRNLKKSVPPATKFWQKCFTTKGEKLVKVCLRSSNTEPPSA